jgi:hypothetical protein
MTGTPGESKGVAFTNWLVHKATGVLERKSSRRGFLIGSAMAGSAVAVAGCLPAVQPGSSYSHITDCAGGLCTDGYTEFCCTINGGFNTCPTGSFAGGWWRADYSSFCNGTRYYIDCMQNCCGPNLGNGFCAGCSECRCAGGCDTRRVYCNYFRYGQCHQEIGISGPIACRVVTCTPPYNDASLACTTTLAVDNSTAEHTSAHPCVPTPPPFLSAAVLPSSGAAVASSAGTVSVLARRTNGSVSSRDLVGSTWAAPVSIGGVVDSGLASVVLGTDTFLFARGTSDKAVWVNRRSGSAAWSGWSRLGGIANSDPTAAADSSGVYVFVRGSDNQVWYQRHSGGVWAASFASLGGTVTSEPVAVSDPAGLFVFARGDDNAVWYRRFVSGNPAPWAGLGGLATSDCAAVSTASGVHVFSRSLGNGIFHRSFSGATPSGAWEPLGGIASSDPVAVADSSGTYVFVRGGDNAIWYRRLTTTWSDWATLGGVAIADPMAVSGPDGIVVTVCGDDKGLWTNRLTTTGWSGWFGLGGGYDPRRAGR